MRLRPSPNLKSRYRVSESLMGTEKFELRCAYMTVRQGCRRGTSPRRSRWRSRTRNRETGAAAPPAGGGIGSMIMMRVTVKFKFPELYWASGGPALSQCWRILLGHGRRRPSESWGPGSSCQCHRGMMTSLRMNLTRNSGLRRAVSE